MSSAADMGPEPPDRGRRAFSRVTFSAEALLAVALPTLLLARGRVWVVALAVALEAVAAAFLFVDVRRRRYGVAEGARRRRGAFVNLLLCATQILALGAMVHMLVRWIVGDATARFATDAIGTYTVVVYGASIAILLFRRRTVTVLTAELDIRPLQTVCLSFGLAILAGTLLLSMPWSLAVEEQVSLTDALFTATSAVCVTGLSVVDVGTHYSRVGQTVLLLLVQAGGVGIMAMYAVFATVMVRHLPGRDEAALGAAVGIDRPGALMESLRFIVATTVLIELSGAGLLWACLRSWPDAGWVATFHAVSAFNNAGFSTFPDSLASLHDRPAPLAVMAALIVLGGLGYPVLAVLAGRLAPRGFRQGLHARVVLATSALMIGFGFVGLLALEGRGTLAGRRGGERLWVALFESVTARTAGFNVADTARLSPAGANLEMLLMLVGASPGSTGGGLKTTTVAVLSLSLVAVLRRRNEVSVFRRTLPNEDVLRAAALVFAALAMLAGGVLLLLYLEPHAPIAVVFEAVSAFTTTGLSMGITPRLSDAGRWVIVGLMFAGRVGPLALLAAFLERRERGRYRYPTERVLFG